MKNFIFEGKLKSLGLFLIAFIFAIGIFLLADRLYSNYLINIKYQATTDNCTMLHEKRHHAFRPYCAGRNLWGKLAYKVYTNNLGLRDARIRDVPLISTHPRVLFLGDSFTDGSNVWEKTFVGRTAAAFPQYEFLNGGIGSYSPSNYYLLAKELLKKGIQIDEVIVFVDISDIQDESSYYVDASDHSVASREERHHYPSFYEKIRQQIKMRWVLTNRLVSAIERICVELGWFHLSNEDAAGNIFDISRSAWTYRTDKLDDVSMPDGYAPLGVEGGIVRAKQKMDQLYHLLKAHGIPISIGVYPWPAQLVHDKEDSRQVQIWQEWCAGKCKRFINTYPKFFEAKKSCSWYAPGCWYSKYYIFGDGHFKPRGDKLVSDAIAESLRVLPVIKLDAYEEASPSNSNLAKLLQ